MARSRNIKPGFFLNEDLAVLPFEARLLYIGLWTLADRDGRLEDRVKRIDAAVFPYDSVDTDKLLNLLAEHGFIVRYEVDERRYIEIPTWHKHQRPHVKEVASVIPPASDHARAKPVQSPCSAPAKPVLDHNLGRCSAALIPDSLSSDSQRGQCTITSTSLEAIEPLFGEPAAEPCPGCLKHSDTHQKYIAQCERLNQALGSITMNSPTLLACKEAAETFCRHVHERDPDWCRPGVSRCYDLLIEPRLQREINAAVTSTSSIRNRRSWAQTWLKETMAAIPKDDEAYYKVGYLAKGRARP